MKRAFTMMLLLAVFGLAHAKKVSVDKAKNAGQTFLIATATTSNLKSSADLELVYTAVSNTIDKPGSEEPLALFYVFNTNAPGFVIVSGDDHTLPILGYSDQGNFFPDSIPNSVAKWLEGYKSQIRTVIEKGIPATTEITEQWESLIKGGSGYASMPATATVNPLMKTQWNQSPHYNALCPGGSVTGCVATAMAQVMKYWNFPATGSGFHSFNHDKYGTLSANFGSTSYQWNSMPNTVSSANSAVATLMYQVGVSVDMGYSPESSGAYVITAQSPVENCSEFALKTYFGYKSTLKGVERASYTDAQWVSLLKAEHNARRPVLYAGFGAGGGHCFVTDGFDSNDYFHFNWGWGGYYDGFFQINALNPSGTGTGGGSGGYNSGHQAVIGVEPPAQNQTFNLALYDYVRPSSTTIAYGQAFTVSTNIVNNGTNTFNGDYAAAIFDNAYNFVDYVEILSGYSLQGGYVYNNNLVFSTSVLWGMLPGTYYVGIFHRPVGMNWYQVGNNGSYTNLVQMTVVNVNDIELYSAISVSPGLALTQGEAASVNLNIINNGAATFKGEYYVGLYNLDGSFAQDIGTVNETDGLPSGYIYLDPFLTFRTSAITVEPGTYLMAVMHNPNGAGWQLTGSSNYQNPIKVTVVEPAVKPDKYENNNSANLAYSLTASFNGNNASVNTDGSTCNISTDNDFYKIVLPSGYNYTLRPRLHDSNSSANGKTYTLDGLFSYTTDGTKWSSAYDDVINADIVLKGGGTIYFHVAPFFAGEIGSYLLDIPIGRTVASGIFDNELDDLIGVYPNPASDIITVDLNNFNGFVNQLSLINLSGQKLMTMELFNQEKTITLPLTDYPEGVYFIRLLSDNEAITKKIVIRK